LILLAFAANPGAGLWRRASAEEWVHLVEDFKRSNRAGKTREIGFRLAALALTAATQSGSPDLRRRAWLASFGILHEALESIQDNDEAWLLVKSVLPPDADWDRCGRLRKGAVETVVRDRWPIN
jgi:hypothetical protein